MNELNLLESNQLINSDRSLADVLPNAIIALDQHDVLLWWNQVAEDLFAITQYQYSNIHDILNYPKFKKYLDKKEQKPIEIQLSNHSKTILSITVIPYRKDQKILMARDVTRIRRLEIMRRDFVANVSHELRTPLTVIHGYLETLIEKNENNTNPWQHIFLQMYQQSVRMEKLINDLLLLSGLESNELHQEDSSVVMVAPLLKEICEDAKALSGNDQHKIQLDADETLTLHGQKDELRSAFSNIIFNAIKYTPARGEINIKWYADEEHAYLKVQDSGIGIAPEHVPRLTERFYRVDKARSRSSGGTGLGLAIVKHVLIRHQGQLEIESEINRGSTFICVFNLDYTERQKIN